MRQSGRVAVEASHGGAGEHGVTGSDLTKECYNELVSLAKQISESIQLYYITCIFVTISDFKMYSFT